MSARAHLAPLLFVVLAGLGCHRDPSPAQQETAKPWPPPVDAGPDVDAGEVPDAASPGPGWHRWSVLPPDCPLWIPDDVTHVDALTWEPCPFMEDGCTRAGAPWAAETGWGYSPFLSVASRDGHTYLFVGRLVSKDWWWEVDWLRDGQTIGAMRSDGQYCSAASSTLDAPHIAIVTTRSSAPYWPTAYIGDVETIFSSPPRVEQFGGAFPVKVHLPFMSASMLVIQEQQDKITIRDLTTGTTEKPKPQQDYLGLFGAVPVGSTVFYEAFTGKLASIWARTKPYESYPVLKDDTYSYDNFVTDGHDAVWVRSQGFQDWKQFDVVELWTSPVAQGSIALQPKKLATLPQNFVPEPSVGEGWAAAYVGSEVHLYRLSDGLERRLPTVPGLTWLSGQTKGLVITGGAVWVQTALNPGPANDIRFITRFDIDKLPLVSAP